MMLFNILHRPTIEGHYEIFRGQQDLVHAMGLKATVLLHYHDLFEEQVVRDALEDEKRHGDEIGLALHKLRGPEVDELAGGLHAIWLLPQDRKRRVLEVVLGRYREVLGRDPTAVASYHLDASTLTILKELCPGVRIVVGGCFEEGVRVFHGCNNSWYLFNEGMPWGPWYPSRTHALRPAADAADAVGVVAVPHLCRDMSLSYEGRNDFWASHPPNVIRGMGNEGTHCPYDRNLLDQYRMQEPLNGGYCYYNTFVSAEWLTWSHNSEYPPEVAWSLYRGLLAYCRELKAAGELQDMTMTEYADWHEARRPLANAAPDLFWAKEILYGSGKHYLWYIDPDLRVLIDTHQGGSIGDLRPYASRFAVTTGPDTPFRERGSYPYLIQSQHRTGYPNHAHDGSRTTCQVVHNGQTIDLAMHQTRCADFARDNGHVTAALEPVQLRFDDGLEAAVQTRYSFRRGGEIGLERVLLSCSKPDAELEFVEYFKACHGTIEYPEDLHGIRLSVEGESPRAMEYDYLGRSISTADRCQSIRPSSLRSCSA